MYSCAGSMSCVQSLSPNIKRNMSYYSPIPRFESIASSLEEVAFHHHSIRGINIKLHLRVIIGEVLQIKRYQDSNVTALSRTTMEISLIKASRREKHLCQDAKAQAELSVTAYPQPQWAAAMKGSHELSSFQQAPRSRLLGEKHHTCCTSPHPRSW